MNCEVCSTELTDFNSTSFRHVHDVAYCAQVLLAQRDRYRAELQRVCDQVRPMIMAYKQGLDDAVAVLIEEQGRAGRVMDFDAAVNAPAMIARIRALKLK
jgi:hypothetical protein